MHLFSRERQGELLVFSEVVLFSFFPIVVVLTYSTLSSIASLAWSTLFASAFFAGVIVYRGIWREMMSVRLWKYVLWITLFIGVLVYGALFVGLEYTTPGNAVIILQFQVFTSFLLFNILRKEPFTSSYTLGAILMVLGAIVILGGWDGFNVGDLIVFVGALAAPIGNFFQQKAREIASSVTIMFLRSLLSAAVFFPAMYFLGVDPSIEAVRASLVFLLINGIVLLGAAKILWIEGIHRISVTKASALVSIEPLFTLLFAWIILSQMPTLWQLLSLPLFVGGVLLLTDHLHFHSTMFRA